ncbi:YtxH-like protein [Mucilaginibacter gracilis]|uniref:YtxH-like protein n=1 Tax=Mucilaginibacter gracilis TaxID=423350 RepID=A0A495J5H7_9SPHI|nr:YtxH domain-containing protein [Mucilaginibacter gracilis]RKR84225.1 YtxH-like protein [Mucilaginibacter gracilis]
MNNQTKLVVGLLAGAAAIAAVGLLFSTDKGTEVREEITDYLADLVNSVKSKAQETADNLNSIKNDAVKNARSAIKSKINDAADIVGN